MICGIGIDSTEIKRFEKWNTYSYEKLLRLFSEEEIIYCLKTKNKSAERFAARFAAKEAFYKALCMLIPHKKYGFSAIAQSVSVSHMRSGHPILRIDWVSMCKKIGVLPPKVKVSLSITHTKTIATAIVVIEYGEDNSNNGSVNSAHFISENAFDYLDYLDDEECEDEEEDDEEEDEYDYIDMYEHIHCLPHSKGKSQSSYAKNLKK